MTDLFGVGRAQATPPLATSMRSTGPVVIVIDYGIRCGGSHRGERCNRLLAERAARPHTHVCPRCGFRNDTT